MRIRFIEIEIIKFLSISFFLLISVLAHAFNNVVPNPAERQSLKNLTRGGVGSHKYIVVSEEQATFTIKLVSNPTTGYSWALKEHDKNMIKMLEHQYIPPDTKLMGASGYELWTFQVNPTAFKQKSPNFSTDLKFQYIRPWTSHESAQTEIFTVVIEQ